MIAAATLGDVVEQGRDVEQPAVLEPRHQARAERILVGELGHGEAPQVAHHLQDVLVDGIDVKQVVLHLADDVAEGRQIATEYVVLVHAPQRVDQVALLEQFEEQRAVFRIASKFGVDAALGAPQGAQGARGHALEFGALHLQQEAFENGARIALEYVFVAHVELLAHHLEVGIEDDRRALACRQQAIAEDLHDQCVELRDQFGVLVVALHQHFGRALGVGRPDAHGRGKFFLMIKQQPVFAAAGQQVQFDAHIAQQPIGGIELAYFGGGDELGPGQRFPVVADAGGACHPLDYLQVAASAGAFLAVGFQAVRRVVELGVAFGLFELLGPEENRRVQRGVEALLEIIKERTRASQVAGFQQCGLDRNVTLGFVQAVIDAAHAMTDIEPDVPQQPDQFLQLRRGHGARLRVSFVGQQDQQIDVGTGIEFAATVAANSGQRQSVGHRQCAPDFPQHVIHQRRTAFEQGRAVLVLPPGSSQCLLPLGQALPCPRGEFAQIAHALKARQA